MRSNLFKIVLSLFFIFSIGCGLKIGERNKTEDENVVELKTGACLKPSLADLKLFFAGDASGEQVSGSLVCLQGVLKDFQTNIRGKNKDAYTPDEISNFLSKQFLKDGGGLSRELLAEVMKLKVLLVGGNTELLTKNEINGIIDVIARLKPELAKLAPHMKIIVSKWVLTADNLTNETKFIKAKEALEVFLNRVGNLLASTERSYEINDLMNLIIEAVKSKGNEEKVEKITKAKALVIKFKQVVIGGDAALKGKEWLPLVRTVGEGYFQLLRYKYFSDNLKENQIAEKWKVHKLVATDIVTLVGDLLSIKEDHIFASAGLVELILIAQDLEYINSDPEKKKFTQKGLDSLFNALFKNILNKPEDRLAKKILLGFNATALQVLATELKYWLENQISIAEIFAVKSEYNKELLLSELSKKEKSDGLKELLRAVSANGLMNFNAAGYLKILTPENGAYHIEDLNKANLSRTLSRVVIRAYANDLERVNKLVGISLEELQFGFNQLKDLVLNLELVDPAKADAFIPSRFRESNLFLSVSNGDALASFEEIDHLVLHIMSGSARAKSLEKLILQKCVKQHNEKLIDTVLHQQCLLDLFFDEEKSFSDLPGFAKLKSDKKENSDAPKVSPEDNKKYYMALLSAAGHIENPDKTVLFGDANLFAHVVQYVEMIYFTFDINRSGLLQREEGVKAFPTFKNLIAIIAKMDPRLQEPHHLGIFIWLLKMLRGPTKIEGLKFFGHCEQYKCRNLETGDVLAPGACNNPDFPDVDKSNDWNIETTRVGIGKIFQLIADLTKPKAPASVSPVKPPAPVTP